MDKCPKDFVVSIEELKRLPPGAPAFQWAALLFPEDSKPRRSLASEAGPSRGAVGAPVLAPVAGGPSAGAVPPPVLGGTAVPSAEATRPPPASLEGHCVSLSVGLHPMFTTTAARASAAAGAPLAGDRDTAAAATARWSPPRPPRSTPSLVAADLRAPERTGAVPTSRWSPPRPPRSAAPQSHPPLHQDVQGTAAHTHPPSTQAAEGAGPPPPIPLSDSSPTPAAKTAPTFAGVVAGDLDPMERLRNIPLPQAATPASPAGLFDMSASGTVARGRGTYKQQVVTSYYFDPRERAWHMTIMRFIVESGMPFNCVKLDSFRRMFTIIVPPGVPGAPVPKPPTYHMVRTTLLDELDAEVQRCVRPVLDTARQSDCTIMTDGWTNIRGQTLCNYLVGTERGPAYLATDVMRGRKDAPTLAKAWLHRLKTLDIQLNDITTFVTDSAGVNVSAMQIFEEDESVGQDAAEITACVGSPPWWEDLRRLCNIMDPVMEMLHMLDSDTRQISKVLHRYEIMIASCLTACDSLTATEQDEILDVFDRRRTMFRTRVHIAAMMLDPEFRDATLPDDDVMQQGLIAALVQFGYPEGSPSDSDDEDFFCTAMPRGGDDDGRPDDDRPDDDDSDDGAGDGRDPRSLRRGGGTGGRGVVAPRDAARDGGGLDVVDGGGGSGGPQAEDIGAALERTRADVTMDAEQNAGVDVVDGGGSRDGQASPPHGSRPHLVRLRHGPKRTQSIADLHGAEKDAHPLPRSPVLGGGMDVADVCMEVMEAMDLGCPSAPMTDVDQRAEVASGFPRTDISGVSTMDDGEITPVVGGLGDGNVRLSHPTGSLPRTADLLSIGSALDGLPDIRTLVSPSLSYVQPPCPDGGSTRAAGDEDVGLACPDGSLPRIGDMVGMGTLPDSMFGADTIIPPSLPLVPSPGLQGGPARDATDRGFDEFGGDTILSAMASATPSVFRVGKPHEVALGLVETTTRHGGLPHTRDGRSSAQRSLADSLDGASSDSGAREEPGKDITPASSAAGRTGDRPATRMDSAPHAAGRGGREERQGGAYAGGSCPPVPRLAASSFYDRGRAAPFDGGTAAGRSACGMPDVPFGTRSIGVVGSRNHGAMREYEDQHGRRLATKTSDVAFTRVVKASMWRAKSKGGHERSSQHSSRRGTAPRESVHGDNQDEEVAAVHGGVPEDGQAGDGGRSRRLSRVHDSSGSAGDERRNHTEGAGRGEKRRGAFTIVHDDSSDIPTDKSTGADDPGDSDYRPDGSQPARMEYGSRPARMADGSRPARMADGSDPGGRRLRRRATLNAQGHLTPSTLRPFIPRPREALNERKLVINPDATPEEEHARRYNRHMGLHEVCVLMTDELLPRELEIRLHSPLPGERQTVVVPECSRAHDCLSRMVQSLLHDEYIALSNKEIVRMTFDLPYCPTDETILEPFFRYARIQSLIKRIHVGVASSALPSATVRPLSLPASSPANCQRLANYASPSNVGTPIVTASTVVYASPAAMFTPSPAPCVVPAPVSPVAQLHVRTGGLPEVNASTFDIAIYESLASVGPKHVHAHLSYLDSSQRLQDIAQVAEELHTDMNTWRSVDAAIHPDYHR
ncbi:hypothetical protein CBR_g4793 [Chara braunii]|uniref:DUF659 domain-containing protein n=1 Tax=Chara braunii TaxID=69332 RepID=A0A388KIT3_CHABU|nr:hypothetical protein CBR_g4793 [Chara braunii]|eukprot:GBG69965.1 hypothetical protein CBR_g4793 [Chara braunii]